ncbi:MAG: carbohydrate porin [Alphaproteobacteria bacterium]
MRRSTRTLRRSRAAFLALVLGLFALPPARAEDKPDAAPRDLWSRETLSGDWAGLRPMLAAHGFTFAFNYIGDTLGAVRGDRRLWIYGGRLELTFEADLEKALGWPGATFHVTGYQIHGRGLTANALGNALAASGIEAVPATRLFTLWLEQSWADKKVSLRIGRLAADDEIAISPSAATFVNGTFGWPGILAANLRSGGPAYPLAAPGARLRVEPFGNFSVLAAVFGGDPAGAGGEPDPQRRNRGGTRFSFAGGVFVIAEAALASGESGWIAGLPGTVKAGFWYHSGVFDDQRYDGAGLSLADPASSGVARRHRGNYGGYFVADQALWRMDGSKERGLDAFLRFGVNPSDRNLVGWYADAGLVLRGAFETRPADAIGIAFGFARIAGAARGLGRDALLFGGAAPLRDHEAVLELTYVAQIAPWWSVQPDFQYVFHPGARAAARDAAVIGVRTTVKF